MSLSRLMGPFNLESIGLTTTGTLHKDVPYIPCSVVIRIQLYHLRRLGILGIIEQQQKYSGGIAAKQSEINATLLQVNT